jgi:two-component system, LytTR family, response regulator
MNLSNQTKLTVVIAEDEPLASELLAEWVAQIPSLQVVAVCHDGACALETIRKLKPQLVFMDINMPGMTGLQVMRELANDNASHVSTVIFTTAYDEHALAAFELHAADYLLKPFSQERLNEAVDHALNTALTVHQQVEALGAAQSGANEPLTRMMIRDQGKIFPVQVADIEYFRSDTKYTAIAYRGRQFLVRLAIAAFEDRLDTRRFIKLQRSCIVNLDYVDSMTPDEMSQLVVKMRDGTQFTASRDVSKQLRNQAL